MVYKGVAPNAIIRYWNVAAAALLQLDESCCNQWLYSKLGLKCCCSGSIVYHPSNQQCMENDTESGLCKIFRCLRCIRSKLRLKDSNFRSREWTSKLVIITFRYNILRLLYLIERLIFSFQLHQDVIGDVEGSNAVRKTVKKQ